LFKSDFYLIKTQKFKSDKNLLIFILDLDQDLDPDPELDPDPHSSIRPDPDLHACGSETLVKTSV
jgi:hypothetical protein